MMNGVQQPSMGFSPMMGGMSPMSGGANPQAALMSSMLNQFMATMMMMSQLIMVNQMQSMVSAGANFGASPGGGGVPGTSAGLGGFLGATGVAPSSVGGSSAPTATSSDFGSVPAWGAALAKDAERNANGPGGWCFKWVRQALERAGVKGVGGASAYMAADQLAKNPKFREIKVAAKDLPKLPAGAVVVWDRGGSGASAAGRQHGHISISLGDGREVSDKVRQQATGMGSNVRVFLPV